MYKLMITLVMLSMVFCSSGQGLTSNRTIVSGGTSRNYKLGLPFAESVIPPGLSVIFVFHGQGGNSAGINATTNFTAKAIEHGFLAVFPDAISGVWDKNVFSSDATDDVLFVKDLITALENQYAINSNKIYATGFSDGAAFVYRLAAEAADKIKAFAPVAGLLQLNGYNWFANYGNAANPAFRKVPILHIHGTGDNATATAYPDPGNTPNDWTEYPLYLFSYPSCNTATYNAATVDNTVSGVRVMTFCNTPVIKLVGVQGLSHTWPNTSNSNYDATAQIMNFFELNKIQAGIQPSLLHVDGKYLKDDCNENIILRGVNLGSIYYAYSGGDWELSKFEEIAKTGANSVRIVLTKQYTYTYVYNGTAWVPGVINNTTAANLEALLQACLGKKMIPILELHDYTGQPSDNALNGANGAVVWWARPDIKDLLLRYQNYLIINLANEPSPSVNISAAEKLSYYQANKTAILTMRNTGYTCPLMIDGLHWGKDHTFFLDYGAALLNDDPVHNLLFSVHLYWPKPSSGAPWWTATDVEITNRFSQMDASNLPFVFGELAAYDVQSANYEINYPLIMELSQQYEFGWLVWWWRGTSNANALNMTNSGNYNDLFGHGLVMATSSPYSIAKTSYIPGKLNNGICNTVLPISELQLHALTQNCTTTLSWQGNASHISSYYLERSYNGIRYNTYEINEGGIVNYKIKTEDQAPTVYYRLKEIRTDNTVKFSNVVTIHNTCFSQPKIYPNPVSDYLIVDNLSIGEKLEVFDIYGKVLIKMTTSNGKTQIKLPGLAKGIYLLKTKNTVHKFIKM